MPTIKEIIKKHNSKNDPTTEVILNLLNRNFSAEIEEAVEKAKEEVKQTLDSYQEQAFQNAEKLFEERHDKLVADVNDYFPEFREILDAELEKGVSEAEKSIRAILADAEKKMGEYTVRVEKAKGPRGEQGEKGDDGIPGKDGSPDTPNQVVEKVNIAEKKVEMASIGGLPEELTKIRTAIVNSKTKHGGGGGGNVVGPASSTADYIPQWNGTTGKLLKEGLPTTTWLKIDQTTPQTVTGGTPIFEAGIDVGSDKITNVGTPTLPHDAVNLEYVQNSLGVDLNYWLENSGVMQTTYVGTPGFLTQTPTQATEQELTNIVFRSSVAQTPAPFVIKNGTECFVHYNAKVTTTTGKKSAIVKAKLYYADADGASNLTQIGVATTESGTLTATSALQETYIVVANEVSIPAGKRLVLKFFSVCSGASTNYPEINVEYGDVHDHLSIPATGAIFGNFLPLAGGTMTGATIAADHEATGLVAQVGNMMYGAIGDRPAANTVPEGTVYYVIP